MTDHSEGDSIDVTRGVLVKKVNKIIQTEVG